MLRTMLFVVLVMVPAWATANSVTHGRIAIEAADGRGHLNDKTWSLVRFDIEDFRINGRCYNRCRLQFTLDGHLPADDRAHIGIVPGKAVRTTFPTPPENRGNPTGFIGVAPFPADMNVRLDDFAPDEKLALAWIVTQSEELLQLAASGAIGNPDAAAAWQKDARRFERDLRKSLRVLRPYIRTLE